MWGHGRRIFHCVDLHCGGEPARILVGGAPQVPGTTMAEKRQHMIETPALDSIRQVLLQEPRGYPCQNLNIIFPSSNPGATSGLGYVILEQDKIYPLFSGHNTICVATALLETGLVPITGEVTEFTLESPGGLINIKAKCDSGRVMEVSMTSMPSFSQHQGVEVDVPEVGKVTVDISFGGMWYVIVEAKQLGLNLMPSEGKNITRLGEMIKVATREQWPVQHPEMDYPGPDILAFTSPPAEGSNASARNTVVMSNGKLVWDRPETHTAMLDRSPCGSGTAAIMANLWKKGKLSLHEKFVHESILGTVFTGRLLHTTQVAGREAVVPEISGRAFITAINQIIVEQDDPLPLGYTVSDIWS